ncbi:MAG: oligosaccharide flippase family protein, partial [Planctomycetota bacterium]
MKRAYRISDRIRARVSPGTTAGRVARSSFWSLAGSFCVQALTLVAIALAARILGPDGLGRFSLLQATMTMFVGLVGMGMAMTATKFISEFRRNDPDRAGRMLGMCLLTAPAASVVLAGGLLLASDLIAQPLLGSETLKLGLQLGCLYLVGSLLKAIQIAALAGLEAFGSIAGANVCRGLATIPLILGGAYLAGANGAMGGLALLSLLDALFSGWLLIRQCRRQSIPLRCLPRREDVILAVRFSLPMVISTAVVNSTLWAVQLILSARGSFAELGIFTAAGRFLAMILMIEAPVGAVLLPLLSSRGKDCSSRLNKASITVSWALGVCPAALLICLPEIMGLLVGSAFATLQARRTLIVAMAYCTIQLYKQGLRRILVTRSKMWYSLLDNAIWA